MKNRNTYYLCSVKVNKRKDTILEAARQVFARYGYDKTTLDDIGQAAGLNKASLYYYYKNKEDIFNAVVLQEAEETIPKLQAEAASQKGIEKQISFYLIHRLRYYRQVLNLNQVSIDSLRTVEPLFHRLYAQVLEAEQGYLNSLLQEGIVQKTLKAHDTARLAGSLLRLADALKHEYVQRGPAHWANEADYTGLENDIDYFTSLILNGLKP